MTPKQLLARVLFYAMTAVLVGGIVLAFIYGVLGIGAGIVNNTTASIVVLGIICGVMIILVLFIRVYEWAQREM